MAYLKPQAPLMNGADYIYPITTADQIIKADGTRLDQNGVITVDQATNATNATEAAHAAEADNATTLNGKSADKYALKTDLPTKAADVGALAEDAQAADSTKLGGKDPKYYLQPRNLLDNSDFRNPVNQRGVSSLIEYGYSIDRWVMYPVNTDEPYSFAVNSGHISLSNSKLEQRLPYYKEDVVYTFATMSASGELNIVSGKFSNGEQIGDHIYIKVSESFGLAVVGFLSGDYLWAALYEGSYTADNLPPYVPKGYAVELAECQRYYLQGLGAFSTGYVLPTKAFNAFAPTPVKMRARPTITIVTRDNAVWSGGTGMLSDITSVEHRSNGLIIAGTLETAPTSIQPFVFASVDFSASADL